MYVVIMAGGQGTRLWPQSRKDNPKQFLPLLSDKPLIREVFERVNKQFDAEKIIISTTPKYLERIQKLIPEVSVDNYVVEPYPMGTAAACGLVSKFIQLRDKNATAVFLPSDHSIGNSEEFLSILKFAENLCEKYQKYIVTIGLKPVKPDTSLGYIHVGEKKEADANHEAYLVERFVEKPDLVKAKDYVDSGEYLWNAGMFVWKVEHILELFKKDLPKTSEMIEKVASKIGQTGFDEFLEENYKNADDTSIDYGIMEKNKDILVVPGDFNWSDIGSWGTLLKVLSEFEGKDVISSGNHISIGDSNILVNGSDKLIATVGLEDIVVVDTPDVTLICNAHKDQEIKKLLAKLKDDNKVEYL